MVYNVQLFLLLFPKLIWSVTSLCSLNLPDFYWPLGSAMLYAKISFTISKLSVAVTEYSEERLYHLTVFEFLVSSHLAPLQLHLCKMEASWWMSRGEESCFLLGCQEAEKREIQTACLQAFFRYICSVWFPPYWTGLLTFSVGVSR